MRISDWSSDVCSSDLATLKVLVEDGRMTAAVASQISDGASALLLASAEAVEKYNLKPRARIHHLSARGDDPIFMLSAPIPATKHAIAKAGLSRSEERSGGKECVSTCRSRW